MIYLRSNIRPEHFESCAEKDVHNEAYPNHRLGLLKLEAVGVKGGCPGNNDARPSEGEAHVGVEVNLLEKVWSR